jgi:hypothetical protein
MNKRNLLLFFLLSFALPTLADQSLFEPEEISPLDQLVQTETKVSNNENLPLENLVEAETFQKEKALDNNDLSPLAFEDTEQTIHPTSHNHQNILQKAWGEQAPNAILGLGLMKSFHLLEDNNKYRTWNYLVGAEYRGLTAGTFLNSHDRRVYLLGVSRSLYHKQSASGFNVDLGYKLGGFYGYREGFPNYHGFMAGALLVAGVGYKAVGIDLMYPVGSNVLTLSTHLYLDPIIETINPKAHKHKQH